uniref:Uncharacterized protein n=1 Tax=Phytophthora ramorum TaxID=164328 RepID=H3GGA0_PHYRM
MANNSTSGLFDRLVFPMDTNQFGVWKDLIVGHLRQKSEAMHREAIVKGLAEPAFGFEDLLRTNCKIPRPMDDGDEEAQRAYRFQQVTLGDQDAYIRALLSQTLPRSYLESLRSSFNDNTLYVAWQRLDTVYGDSNAQGMAKLLARFDAALAMDFKSVGELILCVKEARNRINRQSRDALNGVTVIPNQVESLSRNVFMEKSRSQIEAMQSTAMPANHARASQHLGKRKARNTDRRIEDCFYCDGKYNKDGLFHMKRDCPNMLEDRSLGLMRSKIYVKGSRVAVPPRTVGVAHARGTKKGAKKKARTVRAGIPVDVALLQPISKPKRVAAALAKQAEPGPSRSDTLLPEQAKADEDALMLSPPPTPGSPVVSDTPLSDDDDVDEFATGHLLVLAGKVTEASSSIAKASANIEKTTQGAATV